MLNCKYEKDDINRKYCGYTHKEALVYIMKP